MTDSEIQAIANQVAVSNRQLIIDEIDRRFRMPTGVNSGGPYSSFSVNDQGQIIDASNSTSGVQLLSVHYKNATQTILSSTNTIIDYDQEYHDPNGIVTTGLSWHLTIPTSGMYRFDATIRFNEVASGWNTGDFATLLLFQNGSVVESFDVLDDPQNNTANNVLRCNVAYRLVAADEVALGIAQTSSSSKGISGDFLSMLSIWQC